MRAKPSKLKTLTLLCALALQAQYAHAAVPSQQPLMLGASAPPLMMLVMQRDHKLYYEAYNDASDLDGDGSIDVGFKPTMTYLGYFDSNLCYTYQNARFEPTAKATSMKCSSAWSGNFLNYLTTSRMDALRRVLYGGMRSTDSATETVLERAFIPQDAHSWGKEYTSTAVDGYNISDYAPLSQPSSGKRHLFANTTLLNTTVPLLRVRTNSTDHFYNWVSKEAMVAGSDCATGGNNTHTCTGSLTDYTVRVKVCVSGLLDDVCTQYSSGDYKPTGLLQKYGANESMHFGLLTGSYQNNLSGGVLRKNVGPFTDEIDSSTGVFKLVANNNAGIVNTLNRFKVTGFSGNYGTCGWIVTRAPANGECQMWGNPVGEMMYETVRYFAGAAATSNYSATNSFTDESTALALPSPTWKDPYKTVANGGIGEKVCSKPFMMVISDINPSYDSDELPGSYYQSSGFSGTLTSASGSSLNVATVADKIWTDEGLTTAPYFIGQSGSTTDSAPTAKTVSGFSTIRGLAPEEPTKQGSYYSAAVAKWARTNQVNSLSSVSKIQTFSVALASPLPKISIPISSGSKSITIIPFAKSVSGSGKDGSISTSTTFQPTNQLVDYYITTIKNTDTSNKDTSVNGGRPYYQFMINYEDVEQGADHDMDAMAQYTVSLNSDNTVTVQVDSTYAAGGIVQHMGYIISGSTADGTYLVVRDYDTSEATDKNITYSLDYPSDKDSKVALPLTYTKTFTAGTSSASFIPHDPLWYAAKWGGYKDSGSSTTLTSSTQWDSDNNGTPDNYYLVTNPAKLYDQLDKAFNDVIGRTSTASAVATNSSRMNVDSRAYQGTYSSSDWSGDLKAYSVTSTGGLGTLQWSASEHIPAAASRNIFTWKMTQPSSGNYSAAGIAFSYTNLSTNQLTSLGQAPAFGTTTITAANQTNLINYIRGDQSNEGTSYRARTSLLGDVIDSSPTYGGGIDQGYELLVSTEGGSTYPAYVTAKKAGAQTVYFGANDGMLHAVDATTGAERFAFIPNGVIGNLKYLASTDYNNNHKFFVDGALAYSDAYTSVNGGTTPSWRSFVAGTTGAGGHSVFALDVTNAASFSASNVVWEFTNSDLGDLGYTMSAPTIAKMPNGRWAVIVGNGPESSSGTAKLFIIYLNVALNDATGWTSGQDYCVLSTDTTTDNGLGTPVVVVDSNYVAQYVYAGDVKGRMWRFNVAGSTTSACPSTWTSNKVFTAINSSSVAQPITAAPAVVDSINGTGKMVLFGTGRFYATSDPTDTTVQSLYGILDPLTTTDPAITRSNLTAQTITSETTGTVTNASGASYTWTIRNTSSNTVDYTTKKGWYMDLSTSAGERVISQPAIVSGMIEFPSLVPSADACSAGGASWLYALDPQTGAAPSAPFFDLNYSDTFDSADNVNGKLASAVQYGIGGVTPTILTDGSSSYVVNQNSGTTSNSSGSGASGSSSSGGSGTSASASSGSSSSSSSDTSTENKGLQQRGSRVMATWRQVK